MGHPTPTTPHKPNLGQDDASPASAAPATPMTSVQFMAMTEECESLTHLDVSAASRYSTDDAAQGARGEAEGTEAIAPL